MGNIIYTLARRQAFDYVPVLTTNGSKPMNMTTKLIILVVGMGILSALFLRPNPEQQAELLDLIQNGALVIDTRSPGEFASGHIEGAVNIPYNVIERSIENLSADKDAPIVVYCHSGARSGHARKTLLGMGYTQVVNGGSLRNMHSTVGN